jgi:F-type H+-transporting ATPase subunit delta
VRQQEATARRYAKALYSLAVERGETEAAGRELGAVMGAVASSELRSRVMNPWIPGTAKRAAMIEVANGLGVSKLVRDFVGLLATRGRLDHLAEIAAAYRDLVDESLGRVRAEVRTAVPLTDSERQQLADRLARGLGGKQVILQEVVDPELLGGFIAQVGSRVLDGSLDGQLARIRERLARG